MSLTISYPFSTDTNYTYDSSMIQVTGGKASLLLLDNPNQNFIETFDTDTGFSYDNAKAEFSGGLVRQKNKRPADASFYAGFPLSIDGSWGDGDIVGSATGGADVSTGKLDLNYDDVRYVDYDANNNADNQQVGCIEFVVIPNYSGSPASEEWFFTISKQHNSNNNAIGVRHSAGGALRLHMWGATGSLIQEIYLGSWIVTQGQSYTISINFDISSGVTRVFVDGVQKGSTGTATGTRSSDIGLLRIGSNYQGIYKSNFSIDRFIVFSTVQHTANYTPDWSTVYDYDYLNSSVILPEMEYTGAGSLSAFDVFSVTEGNSPKYVLQIGRSGNYLYWTGTIWTASDGTYAQANDSTAFNLHVDSLPVSGEKYGQFKIIFDNSNTLSSVSELTATLTGQIYSTANPTILFNSTFRTDSLCSFTEISTKTGSDELKYVLAKGGDFYYFSGSAWIISDETYSQSNTAIEIETNKASFTALGVTVTVKAFLHSADGTTTPQNELVVIDYDFSGESVNLNEAIIYGNIFDISATAQNSTAFSVKPASFVFGLDSIIVDDYITIAIRSDGYFETSLYYDDVQPSILYWNFGGKRIVTNFLAGTNKFSSLTRR